MSINVLNTKAKDPTDAVMGLDLDGKVYHIPLSEGPHWIVAGQTGSGKSVFANAVLISIMSHATPEEVQIFTIDPKNVEFSPYKGLPYCPIDPIVDMGDAYGLTAYLTWLMDERYKMLADVDVKKLPEFNDWIDAHPDEAAKKGYEKMPYIIMVCDEYADLMSTNKDVEKNIIRLGAKSRASGIHCFIMTQRPSAD